VKKKDIFLALLGLGQCFLMSCFLFDVVPDKVIQKDRSKPVMVIATFDAKGVEADDVEFVMDIFTSNFANMDFARIVDRNSFDKIKKELSFQDSDWSDSKKVAELGRALNANQVAVGQLTKRGDNIFLNVKILDVNTTTIITSHLDKVTSIDSFFDWMPGFCNTLISKAGGKASFTSSPNTSSSNIQKDKATKEYNIGDDGPGGGTIFYKSKEGFKVYDYEGDGMVYHYLEMSRSTLGESEWYPGYGVILNRDEGIGYGKKNTYAILKIGASGFLTKENCAAYRCAIYSTSSTKAGEWWLPSKDELDLMYQNQKERVLATCDNHSHWSSTESSRDCAFIFPFMGALGERGGYPAGFWSDGQYYGYKDRKHSVRAVRAF